MRIDILGVGFDNLTMDEAVQAAIAHIKARGRAYVVTPNPEIVMLCRERSEVLPAVNGADMVLADGIGVVYGAKILKTPLKERVAGFDFACGVLSELAKAGGSVFLFGAKPSVADMAAAQIERAYPGIIVCGTNDGYFDDDLPIIAKINASRPDFLLVCLGAPKQELWMRDNAKNLDVGLMAGLGGSLDIFAGTMARAPELWQKLGLEWLYRLLKEPRRICRMMKLPRFMLAVIGKRLRGKKDAR